MRELEFEPRVVKSDKATKRPKGLDITLATEMLADGFRSNCDAVVLVTGELEGVCARLCARALDARILVEAVTAKHIMVPATIPRSGQMLAVVLVGLLWAISGCRQSAGEGAAKALRERAEQGDADAQYELGITFLGKDNTEAVRWFRKAADQGNASAQFNLGSMARRGEGVSQDYTEAIRWFRKAADQGNASAQFNVGSMARRGEGVSQDYTEAIRWYRKAADQGNARAQFNLGSMYDKGEGVPQDYVLAHKWKNLAAARATGKNTEEFAKARDAVAAKMTADQIAEAHRLAREWKPNPTER